MYINIVMGKVNGMHIAQ